MKLDIDKISEKLKTNFLGQSILYAEQMESTQDEAKSRLQFIKNGTYIVTDKQTKGKGTHDRIWYDKGYENICGTFVVKPNCHINKIDGITVIIAESVIQTIKNLYNIDLNIKYPNDILCNNKKLCGVLTESITNAEIVKFIIVGIGVNVNQVEFQPEIEEIATSLKKEFGRSFSREDIIAEFFNVFEERYLNMIQKQP